VTTVATTAGGAAGLGVGRDLSPTGGVGSTRRGVRPLPRSTLNHGWRSSEGVSSVVGAPGVDGRGGAGAATGAAGAGASAAGEGRGATGRAGVRGGAGGAPSGAGEDGASAAGEGRGATGRAGVRGGAGGAASEAGEDGASGAEKDGVARGSRVGGVGCGRSRVGSVGCGRSRADGGGEMLRSVETGLVDEREIIAACLWNGSGCTEMLSGRDVDDV
jgi:hypothetical protein